MFPASSITSTMENRLARPQLPGCARLPSGARCSCGGMAVTHMGLSVWPKLAFITEPKTAMTSFSRSSDIGAPA